MMYELKPCPECGEGEVKEIVGGNWSCDYCLAIFSAASIQPLNSGDKE